MSVVLEFTIATADFAFGDALATTDDLSVELEAIVPIGQDELPYFWVTGTGVDFDRFERQVLADEHIGDLEQFDRIEDTALYRARQVAVSGLLQALVETEGVILEAYNEPSHDRWQFRVRFPEHERVAAFYDVCTDHGLGIDVVSVLSLSDARDVGTQFGLTPEQHEAITLAVRRGYYEVPRGTDLGEIADELDISQQAASKRVRRATDNVLRAALFARQS